MKTKMIALALSMLLNATCFAGCAQPNANDAATPPTNASNAGDASGDASGDAANDDASLEISEGTSAPAPVALSVDVSNSDVNTTWDDSATQITLSGTDASVTGAGITVSGNVITIVQAGTYVVSGTLDNGQIAIAATNKDKVHLVLNGVSITNRTGAPIYASQCDKLTLTLAEGTQNTLTDGGMNFQYADASNEEPNAALFCKDDLSINGTGSLTVNAGFHNGIGTKDDLTIVSGNIAVNAANHGLRGNDSITIIDGNFTIVAENDGVQTNNTEDATLGWIQVEGGVFTITAAHDALQADTTIAIAGGQFHITTGGQTTPTDSTSDSYKGLKSSGDISITGGSFAIVSTDDALHANGNIAIDGGSFTLSTEDDGIHADGDLTIGGSSTNIEILTSYEGLEAKTMTIADGTITLTATDDGINIAGGSDQSGVGGRFGRDQFSTANSDQWLKITGGTITVTAGSDGIDINGSGEMTGGDVNVTAATIGEGDTIDSDGAFNRAGGNLTESGGNGARGTGETGKGGRGRGGRGTGGPGDPSATPPAVSDPAAAPPAPGDPGVAPLAADSTGAQQ